MTKPTLPTLVELKRWLPQRPVLIGWLVLAAVVAWTYSSAISLLVGRWWHEPDYGHCFFVPAFAVVLLWIRRDMVDPMPTEGSWWGLAFLGLAAAFRWASAYFFFQLLNPFSLIPFFAGLALFVGGWRVMRWAWPAVVFLVFMVPLPGFLAVQLSSPLQRIGTVTSVFVVQTLGVAAVDQGNVIVLTEGQLGVVEACSGLRMLMLFFAVCIGAAFVLRCALWEKAIIVVSAIPIAVLANVCRITLTALLYEAARVWPTVISTATADKIFHDFAGLLMMPVAMLLLWGEMTLLKMLFVEPVAAKPLTLAGSLTDGLRQRDSRRTTN
jgi:exosortase